MRTFIIAIILAFAAFCTARDINLALNTTFEITENGAVAHTGSITVNAVGPQIGMDGTYNGDIVFALDNYNPITVTASVTKSGDQLTYKSDDKDELQLYQELKYIVGNDSTLAGLANDARDLPFASSISLISAFPTDIQVDLSKDIKDIIAGRNTYGFNYTINGKTIDIQSPTVDGTSIHIHASYSISYVSEANPSTSAPVSSTSSPAVGGNESGDNNAKESSSSPLLAFSAIVCMISFFVTMF